MKKTLIVLSTVLLLLVLASCVSTNGGEAQRFYAQDLSSYSYEPGLPMAIMANGTQVGTATVNHEPGQIEVEYEMDPHYRVEMVDQKIYEDGSLYDRYYTTHPPDRYNFIYILNKDLPIPGKIKIEMWLSKRCCFYQALIEIEMISWFAPSASITAVSEDIGGFGLFYDIRGELDIWDDSEQDSINVLDIKIFYGFLQTPGDFSTFTPVLNISLPPSGIPIIPPNHEIYPYSMVVPNLYLVNNEKYILAIVSTDVGELQALAGPLNIE